MRFPIVRRASLSGQMCWMACLTLVAALAGCGSTVVPTTSHPAITSDKVKIYTDTPKKYEILGTLSVPISADVHWDDKGNADAGFEQLKSAAAAEGANGILLIAPPGTTDVRVVVGYQGTMYQVPLKADPKTAIVQAIYVVEEK
jgi:hypothetical protein